MRLPATAAFLCLALVAAPTRASAPPYPDYPAYPPAAPGAPNYPPWPHYPRAPRAPSPPDAPFPPDAPSPPPRSPPPPRPPHHPHPPHAPPSPPPPRPPPTAPSPPPPPPPPPAPADPAVAFAFVAFAGFVVVAAAWLAHFAGSDVDAVDYARRWIERNAFGGGVGGARAGEDDEEAAGAYAELRNVEGESDDERRGDRPGPGRRRDRRGWTESAVHVASRAFAAARGFARAGSDAFDAVTIRGVDDGWRGGGDRGGGDGDDDDDDDDFDAENEDDEFPAPRHHLRGPARGRPLRGSARWLARRAVDPNAAYEPLAADREDARIATADSSDPRDATIPIDGSGDAGVDTYVDADADVYADRTYDDDYMAESDASGRSGASARSARRLDRGGGAATMRFYGASAARARAAMEAAGSARRGGPDATEWRDDDL